MDSTKDLKRTRIPFEIRAPISKKSRELLADNFGYVREVLDGGIVTTRAKELKGDHREAVD